MLRRKKKLFASDEEIDPMIYAVNMVDCMLVLAVGFLIFTIISMNLQGLIYSDLTPQEKTQVAEIVKQTMEINKGQQLNSTPETQSGSTGGYQQAGIVYKDPKTGKLIMVQSSGSS